MIRIVTDSTCDLSPQRREELGVHAIPLRVHFGEDAYLDGVDLDCARFYEKLRSVQELPHTSQPNPDEMAAAFRPYLEQGDEIVGIFLSSRLSGTFQSAAIAAGLAGKGEIYLVDSGAVTFSLGLLVEHAAALRDKGLSAHEIAREVEELAPRLRLYAVVDTLKYLKMGGRISAATAVVGGMLGITPILRVQDGVVEAAGKSRGRKGAYKWMLERLEEEPADLSLPVAFGHGDAPQIMAECREAMLSAFPGARIIEGPIGSVVGTHAGPGAAGFAYFVKE